MVQRARLQRRRRMPRLEGVSIGRLIFLLVALVLLASCAGDGDDPTATSEPETPTAAAAQPQETPTAAAPPPETPTMAAVSAPLGPCSAIDVVSWLQTPVPVTPEPTPEPTPGPAPTPAPTSTLAPAPSEDRVGYPENYKENFHLLYVFDRADNVQVRVICGNDQAVSAEAGEPLPYGSILVMETWRARRDADGNPVLDDNGRFIRETLGGIFIMRKEPGFGEAYEEQRSGEWEYVAFRPDQSYLSPPERTNACAACHQIVDEEKDFVFRLDLYFDPEGASTPPELAENEVNIFAYEFLPGDLEVKAGTTVTWINNDAIDHTVTASDGSFDSGMMLPGDSFSHTFDEPGTFEYICSVHGGMAAATIVVVP